MRKKIVSLLLLIGLLGTNLVNIPSVFATPDNAFMLNRNVDKRTFNEYRYKLTKELLAFEQSYSIHNDTIDKHITRRIKSLVERGYKFLPDNLTHTALKDRLITSLLKGIAEPTDRNNYNDIKSGIKDFIFTPKFFKMSGSIKALPLTGNAPFVTTLNADVKDGSGVNIPKSSYVWWMDLGNNRRVIIGVGPSISYKFENEGNHTVFLDVRSKHTNSFGNTDVLPFSGKVEIKVLANIAKIAFRISGRSIPSNGEIKFDPSEAKYGLIFDATSSSPSQGTRFMETYWDFGNGVKKKYDGGPRIERVIYNKEGSYDVKLIIKTNIGRVVEKKFKVFIHNPVAVIEAKKTEGYLGESFNFSTKIHGNQKGLSFLWEIVDINNNKNIKTKQGKSLNHIFQNKGDFSVMLKITDGLGKTGTDKIIIHINSRAPTASFNSKILSKSKPNEIYLDATDSFDPDKTDEGKLKYIWTIDGMNIDLKKSNKNGSTGYYTFDSLGEHSILLEVEDPDGIIAEKKGKIKIDSLLSLDFVPRPRVIQRNKKIKFTAYSKNAIRYDWDFGDGITKSTTSKNINHPYNQSGIFTVTLTVHGDNEDSNSVSRKVYIGDSKNPVALLNIGRGTGLFKFQKETNACSGDKKGEKKDAFIISRDEQVKLSSKESIDTSGKNTGLYIAWKIGKETPKDGANISTKFDELGCFKIKLTVKSKKDGTSDTKEEWVKVVNLKPELKGLKVTPVDINTDPIIVKVQTVGAKDKDGAIQSYLWSYKTDNDEYAQDFKMTTKDSTTFVIPKVGGNYHFKVILKDNNGKKTDSDKVGLENTLMLAGDNINTPLIDLSVTNNSIAIGESTSFTAKVTNINQRDINKGSKFSWDFDGDGFYEKQKTSLSRISHSYKKEGTYYAKVKVKHKGFSNTRVIKIDVVNKLHANFKYVSIGNKYIFVDKSKGTIDGYKWDLGDGNKVQNKNKFSHEYDDNKPIHRVKLVVSDGTGVNKITRLVKKNGRNIHKTKDEGIHVFAFPKIGSNDTITLDNEESVFIYLGESKGDFENYGIDYDTHIDEDMNGAKDDDKNNANNLSFKKGTPDEITLNNSRIQNVRVFLLDSEGATVDSKDITIEKTYISEEEEIKVKDFLDISDETKIKIDELKTSVRTMPKEYRLKGMKYIQELQEQWKDVRDRARTILNFEGYILETGISEKKKTEIITILETLFITDGEGGDGEKDIAFAALKALLPKNIKCLKTSEPCNKILTDKLEVIYRSLETEENRKIGKEILQVIKKSELMDEKDRNDFYAILKILIYSKQAAIPDKEKAEIEKGDKETGKNNPTDIKVPTDDPGATGGVDEKDDGKLMVFLKKVGIWALRGLGVLFIGMFIFWLIDFLKNRKSGDDGDELDDFIDTNVGNDDILGDNLIEEPKNKSSLNGQNKEKKSGVFSEEKTHIDPLASNSPEKEKKVETKSDAVVPDWLSGTTTKTETVSKEEENVGFSLTSGDETSKKEIQNKEIPTKSKVKEKIQDFNLEEETKLENTEVPDWLKETVTDELPKKKEESEKEFLEKNKENKKNTPKVKIEEPIIIEDKEEEKIDLENDVPDWLKETDNKKETKTNSVPKKTPIKIENKTPQKQKIVNNNTKTKTPIKRNNIKKTNNQTTNKVQNKKVDTSKESSKKTYTETKKTTTKKIEPEIISSEDNVPDWLKNDDSNIENSKTENKKVIEEKTSKENITKSDVQKNPEKEIKSDIIPSDDNIPDWLKGSIEEETPKTNKEEKKEIKKSSPKKEDPIGNLEQNDVPDWLKDSLVEGDEKKKKETEKKKTEDKKENKTDSETKEKITKKDETPKKENNIEDDVDIPDWLK